MQTVQRRTVTVTRPSPYGNGVEQVQLGIDIDPLEWMAQRRQITLPQKQAGDRFKAAYEGVSGSRGLGIDYTQERVDTSGVNQAVPQRAIDGMAILKSAINVLGKQDYSLVSAVCGQGMTIHAYARRVSGAEAKKNAREYVGERFRDALTALAVEWGYERSDKARSRAHRWSAPEGEDVVDPVPDRPAWVHPANRPRQ